MPPRIPRQGSSLRRARAVVLAIAAATLYGCHPGSADARQLRDACETGDAQACNKFAVKLQKGEYVLRDDTRAAGLFDRSCVGGVAESCASFGIILQTGAGVKRDSVRALDMFRKACEGKGMEGCARLGVLLRDGKGVPRDIARAA